MDNLNNPEIFEDRDKQLDATLAVLSQVQPPVRLEQRIHARLAQESANGVRAPFFASFAAGLTSGLTSGWTWPRAAFATATFTAGVVTATLLYPVLHTNRAVPASGSPAAATSATAVPASANTAQPAPAKLADVHPAFTVRTPDGRAAALNTMGTVATVRSRREHSDTQLAANRRDRKSASAKLTKPAAPADASTTVPPVQTEQ